MSRFPVTAAAAAASIVFGFPALAQDDLVKRGEYLVNGPAACANCHATRNPDMSIQPGMELAGGFRIVDPALDVTSANITPDPETGIGDWTDDEIIRAIREGVDREGNVIWPPMPVPTYNNMSDDDVKAIVAYLRSVPPVVHEVAGSSWNIPQMAMPPAKGTPAPPTSDKVAYGAYLVTAIAHCFECHTPMGPNGPDMTKLGAGGVLTISPEVSVAAANITPDPETGIGNWSDAEIKTAMTEGVAPDGHKVAAPMPVPWFRNMTGDDLDAIVAFLRTIPPVSNKVERTAWQVANFP